MPGVKGRSGGARPGSGRPKGKQSKAKQSIVELAKSYAVGALNTLNSIHGNTNESAGARVSAATAILERGYGKPGQTLEHTGAGGGDIKHDIVVRIVRPKHDR